MTARAIRQELLRRRHALLARYHGTLERANEELASHESEDVERATEQWDAQVLSTLGDGDVRALAEITAALRRIDDGMFGCCALCAEEIGDARLAALPTATTCIACAKTAEQRTTRGAVSAR